MEKRERDCHLLGLNNLGIGRYDICLQIPNGYSRIPSPFFENGVKW